MIIPKGNLRERKKRRPRGPPRRSPSSPAYRGPGREASRSYLMEEEALIIFL